MAAMNRAMRQLSQDGGEVEWLSLRELMTGRPLMCSLLPADHPFRGGEYCG
jgi:hypothetical protein